MDKTNLDELVTFPAKVMQKIASDNNILSLILNKPTSDITENDVDNVLENNVYDYQYVDDIVDKTTSLIFVETEVDNVENKHIKDMTIYITVVCHKDIMTLDRTIFKGFQGNRRDNLVRYIDATLQQSGDFGIGNLSLKSIRTQDTGNAKFSARLLTYAVSGFNCRR